MKEAEYHGWHFVRKISLWSVWMKIIVPFMLICCCCFFFGKGALGEKGFSSANCDVFYCCRSKLLKVPFLFKQQIHSACNYHWYFLKKTKQKKLGPPVFGHLQFHTVATYQSAFFIIFRLSWYQLPCKCIKCLHRLDITVK